MNFKVNVNKIHGELLDMFGSVTITEKNDRKLGSHFEINVLCENKNLIIKVTKESLENSNFNWKYMSNPEKEESLVERFSSVDNFTEAVLDIFEKNRFDSEYLKKHQND